MPRRLVPTALAVFALALVGFSGPAEAAKTCFGAEPTIVGTDGDDVITVFADEAGVFGRINGERYLVERGGAVVSSGPGNDEIRFNGDPGRAVVCAGKGNDAISGNQITKVSAGPGKDQVTLSLVCAVRPVVYDAEKVEITGFDSVEEGPCN